MYMAKELVYKMLLFLYIFVCFFFKTPFGIEFMQFECQSIIAERFAQGSFRFIQKWLANLISGEISSECVKCLHADAFQT